MRVLAEVELIRRYYNALSQLAKTRSMLSRNMTTFVKGKTAHRLKWIRHLERNPHLPLAQMLKLEIIKQRLSGK